MDLSQGKFVDDTQETILVKDKVVNGYGSDTPYVAKQRYGISDEPSTYARQQKEVNNFLSNMNKSEGGYVDKIEDSFLHAVNPLKVVTDFVYGEGVDKAEKEVLGNVATGVATTATSMFYGAEMLGATVPTFAKNVGMGYKYYADMLFKSEEELNSPEYIAQWAERQKTEDAVIDAVKEIHKRSGEVAGKIGEALGVGEENVGSFVGQTLGNVAASLGICYITKNPALTAAVFALPTYENVLGTSVENGKDLTTSAGVALAAGTATGFLERWGLQNLIENITTKTLKAAIGKSIFTEGVEEFSQQGVEDASLIFWAKDKQFVDENGNIRWSNLLIDLGSAAFGGALGGALGGGIGAGYVQNKINNTIEGLVKDEKYTRGEAETIVNYLLGDDEKARSIYDAEVVGQQIGETQTYEEFVLANTELKQARQVMDNISEQMSDPKQVEQIVSETMNEALDPANLPNESLDDFAKMVKDSKEQITQQMQKQAEEERKKYDVRDIVESKGADKRTIDASKEAVQAFAESEAEEFGVTPRQIVEGRTITLANLTDNSGLSSEEKQQILEQSGLANEETVVAKENGQAPTQEEMDEAYAMMNAEQDKGYIPNEYMQFENIGNKTKVSKSEYDLKKLIQTFPPRQEFRLMYDKDKGYWFVADSMEQVHSDIMRTAYRNGLYTEFKSESEAMDYFNDKTYANDGSLVRFVAFGYENNNYMDRINQMADDYSRAYIIDNGNGNGVVLFARYEDDIEDAGIENLVKNAKLYDTVNNRFLNNVFLQSEQDDKDLVVQHATTLNKLNMALELGGLPMPSLAVTKKDLAASGRFGEITFVGGSDIIDPSVHRGSKTYSADIYSPRMARPLYELTGEGEKYIDSIGAKTWYLDSDALERIKDASESSYSSGREPRYVYLHSLGKDVEFEYDSIDKAFKELTQEQKDKMPAFLKDFINKYTKKKLFKGFTPSGKRTYLEYNIDNVIKLMKENGVVGQEHGFGTSPNVLKSVWSKPLKTIKEIKKQKNRIVSQDEYKKVSDEYHDAFYKMADKLITTGTKQLLEGSYTDPYDHVVAWLAEIKDGSNIKAILKEGALNDSDEAVNEVKSFIEYARSIPTQYFESKPIRAVDFNEFSGVIMPSNEAYNEVAKVLSEEYGLDVQRVSDIRNKEEVKKALGEIQKKYPRTFFQQEQQPRAFISFEDEANVLVGMLNSADISALPHEMVHGFTRLHVQNCIKYNKFSSIEDVMKYFGVTDPMELITNVDIQERMARMGIKYVQESEAPTAGLRRYFEMFKRFGKKLVSGWKSKGLIDEEELPDEVRKFFDSLLGKKKKEKIDYERIAEQKADVIQAIKRIKAGEAVDISGLPISEVRKLMKVMQTRIPRMPQNLKNALIQAGGIDIDFAKNFDFIQTSGEEKNYRLFKRNGAINSEDSLIEFLETNGFIARQEMEDYNDTAEQWERVEQAIENMDNTYREQDMEKVLEREQIEEGIDQANEIIKAVGAEDAFEVIEDIDKLKGRVVAEKEYLESLERRVKNLDKDYKKLYDQLLKDQAREFAQETKEQVKQAKEEIKDYRNQVIDFIKKQDIELKDKAKLISVVKKANTKASFEKVINEVKERAANMYRKEQVRRLSDLIQKEVLTKRPALKNQKYAYEENKLFSDLRDWNKLNKSEAGIRYQAMHDDEEFMSNLTREDEIRLLFLEYKAMGADSSPQLLNTLLNYIEIAKQVGMESRNEQEYQKAMSRDETKEEMIKQVESRKGKPTIYVKFASNLYSSLYTIFGKDIADKYELETVQNKANIRASNHIDKVVKEAMKLYGVKSKGEFLNVLAELGKKAATITTVNNNIDTPLSKVGITKELSTLEIMDIYNAIKNEKTRDDYYYWYGKDQIDGLLSKLTNNEMIWADMMMESVDERYAPVNEAFVKTYYTDLPKVDNYWMATSEHKEVKTVFDVQGDFNQQSPSFLKERVKSRVLPKPMNAYSKYTKHIKGTYWVTDMADKQVELLNLLSSLRVKNAIENKLGKDTYNALKRQVEALSFGGLMEDVDYVTGIIDKAINNVVVAKISLGIPVFTGQLSSVGLYSENMGTAKWGIGFAEGLSHPVKTYKFMKEYVGEFLDARFGGGYDETIESVLREAEDGKAKYSLSPKSKYNIVNALTLFVRTGDIGAIIYGGYPRLKQLLETMPREEAVKQFEKETLRGQQASVTASKSAFQQRKGIARVFTSFRNFQYQAVRKIVDSVYGYMNGEISAAQAGKTIALYALYSPIAYELFRQLGNMLFIGRDAFKDIDEKLFNTILMQELSIIPIANDIVNYAIKKYLGQYAKSGITTVGIDDLFRAVDKAYKNDKDIYDYGEIVSPFIEMITGMPSQRIISTTKKVLEKYD